VSYALGQPVPLTALVVDDAGAAANATTVTLTITLPDGTTATPTVTNPPATTGTYTVDYLPAAEGLYGVRWVFTGGNATAPPVDGFYVEGSLPPLVSLAEAREQVRAYSTSDDALLQRYSMVSAAHCERVTRVWRRQTLSAVKYGGSEFVQLPRPVISVTSVTENGITVPSTGYHLDAARGRLYRGTQTWQRCWAPGVANVAATVVAGASDGVVPQGIRQGNLYLIEHLWATQRGGSGLPRSDGGANWDIAMAAHYTLPTVVIEHWATWMRTLGR
jgi:hypothetical protein